MLSVFYFFIIYNFYIFIILSSGFAFKKIFWFKNNDNLTIGEIGIFGFIFIYLIITFFHYFFPINIIFSITIYFLFSIFFLFEFKNIKSLISLNLSKNIIYLYLLGFLTAITTNLHDDWQLYQLPIINYVQQFKIVFGFISLNDYYGQGHGFYEIMSIFQLPIVKNSSLYLIPVVFVVFALSHILSELNKTDTKGKLFIFFIVALILLRFSRSKEYGTDLPVICLLFMIQIYVLNFIKKPNTEVIFKTATIFVFAVFLKIYAILAIFYSLFLLKKANLKFISEIFKLNRLSTFIFLIILSTVTKNLITSGCVFYQISGTCLDKDLASWSIGKEVAKERNTYLTAATKGWKAYVRTEQPKEFVTATQYLELSKYNYLKYLSKDAIFDRLIITLLICFFFIFFHISKLKKKENNNFLSHNKTVLIGSLIAVLLWIINIPNVRYGGYAYVPFFLFMIIFSFFEISKLNMNFIKIFISLCLIFFITKNLNRISKEFIVDKSNNYPFSNFEDFKYKTINIDDIKIRVPTDGLWCGNIKMLCSSEDYLISSASIKNSYIFLKSKEQDMIKFINRTAYYDTIEENDIKK